MLLNLVCLSATADGMNDALSCVHVEADDHLFIHFQVLLRKETSAGACLEKRMIPIYSATICVGCNELRMNVLGLFSVENNRLTRENQTE